MSYFPIFFLTYYCTHLTKALKKFSYVSPICRMVFNAAKIANIYSYSWKRIKFWQGKLYLKGKGAYFVYVTAF